MSLRTVKAGDEVQIEASDTKGYVLVVSGQYARVTGADLKAAADVDWGRTITRRNSMTPIADNEAVVLEDGDVFDATPRAFSSGATDVAAQPRAPEADAEASAARPTPLDDVPMAAAFMAKLKQECERQYDRAEAAEAALAAARQEAETARHCYGMHHGPPGDHPREFCGECVAWRIRTAISGLETECDHLRKSLGAAERSRDEALAGGEGFWGRACARLLTQLDEARAALGAAQQTLEEACAWADNFPSCENGWRGDFHETCRQQLEVYKAEVTRKAREWRGLVAESYEARP